MQIDILNKNTHNSKIANKLKHTYSTDKVSIYNSKKNKSSTIKKSL